MKRHDLYWLGALASVLLAMLSPWTRESVNHWTAAHPYIMGFVKFFLLASLGELLAIRLNTGSFKQPAYIGLRAIIWGVVGVLVVYTFGLYSAGVHGLMETGMLPQAGRVFHAFMTSLSMNFTFAPAFMAAHRISDQLLDRRAQGEYGVKAAVRAIDWPYFYSFVLGKTVPLFWVPAHTLTFLLPANYRVLVAALLSMALGLILSLAKQSKKERT